MTDQSSRPSDSRERITQNSSADLSMPPVPVPQTGASTETDSDSSQTAGRLSQLVERLDRPLLALAMVAVLLYMMDLLGIFTEPRSRRIIAVVAALIDLVFVIDLVCKLILHGRTYLKSPWFLTDFLSCLPAITLLGVAESLNAIRFVRGLRVFRMLRTLRVLRLLRMLKLVPAFEEELRKQDQSAAAERTARAIKLGVLVYSVLFLLVILSARSLATRAVEQQVAMTLQQAGPAAAAESYGLTWTPDPARPQHELSVRYMGEQRTAYIHRKVVEAPADHIECFVVLGSLLAMGLFLYLVGYQIEDVSSRQLRALLNIALPKQVARQFIRKPDSYKQKTSGPATILFMDFVGFTRTCDRLGTRIDELSEHLEHCMDVVVAELSRHDLIIDKFIGDAVMSFRGGPLVSGTPAEHAFAVVQAALRSQEVLRACNNPYFHGIKVGGASGDQCLIGAFGTSSRLSYTVLGDRVNLAARLEPASSQCGTSNLFCDETYRLCADRPELVWRRFGQLRVPGKEGSITVYEAFSASDNPGEFTFLKEFESALAAFEERKIATALERFICADTRRPSGDGASQTYARWCRRLLDEGLPENWQPIMESRK